MLLSKLAKKTVLPLERKGHEWECLIIIRSGATVAAFTRHEKDER